MKPAKKHAARTKKQVQKKQRISAVCTRGVGSVTLQNKTLLAQRYQIYVSNLPKQHAARNKGAKLQARQNVRAPTQLDIPTLRQ